MDILLTTATLMSVVSHAMLIHMYTGMANNCFPIKLGRNQTGYSSAAHRKLHMDTSFLSPKEDTKAVCRDGKGWTKREMLPLCKLRGTGAEMRILGLAAGWDTLGFSVRLRMNAVES